MRFFFIVLSGICLSLVGNAGPYAECFEGNIRSKISEMGCDLNGQTIQMAFAQSKRSCAVVGTNEILPKITSPEQLLPAVEQLQAGMKPFFVILVNAKIKSCGFRGEFKFNPDGRGGELNLIR